MAGLATPTHALLLLAAVAAFLLLGRLTRGDAEAAAAAQGRRARRRARGFHLRWPTRGEAHVVWLVVCALVAFVFTRGVAMPLFVLVFFVLWLAGYGVLARVYR
jgi:hypothetical protein